MREYAKTDPIGFLKDYPAPLLIDEVQYAPELFPYLKMQADSSNDRQQYWLTGSQTSELMKNAAEYLVGRAGIIKMNSFTYAEINDNSSHSIFTPGNYHQAAPIAEKDLFETIFKGGMPELYSSFVDKNSFFQSYVDLYLERDVKNNIQINNEVEFRKFIRSVALRTGEILNYTSLADDAGITVPTAKSWLSALVESGLVYLLEAYSNSKLKQLVKSPKIVFMDLGLASFLAGWSDPETLRASSASGHFLESFVVSEIVKSYQAQGILNPEIYYYRDHEHNEIDLVFSDKDTLYPFEIKKTSTPDRGHTKNFAKLEATGKRIGQGGLICFYEHLIPLAETGNMIIPIGSVVM